MVGQAKLEDSNVALMNRYARRFKCSRGAGFSAISAAILHEPSLSTVAVSQLRTGNSASSRCELVCVFSSDLAKRVREEAATYEKEWKGAGAKPGIEIWRAENLGIKRWPQTEYGSFFMGDSYIVLNTYKAPEGDKLLYNVHFWLGRDTSQDEAGVAAYKTVELDDLLGQLPIQFREVMGSESPEFLKLFKPAMTIMEGGIASGFKHVEPKDYKPRLMHIKGKKENSMKVVEVPLSLDSLNDGDSFVLDAGMQLWQWNGSSAGVFEKRQGQAIVNQMK
jgi:gelsolin